MRIENDKVVFAGGVAHSVLPDVALSKANFGDVTPAVPNMQVLVFVNVSPVTVTNFDGGASGQTIRCLGDGNTTIQHGTSIKTNTAANKLLAANKMYVFTYYAGVWYEDA